MVVDVVMVVVLSDGRGGWVVVVVVVEVAPFSLFTTSWTDKIGKLQNMTMRKRIITFDWGKEIPLGRIL